MYGRSQAISFSAENVVKTSIIGDNRYRRRCGRCETVWNDGVNLSGTPRIGLERSESARFGTVRHGLERHGRDGLNRPNVTVRKWLEIMGNGGKRRHR